MLEVVELEGVTLFFLVYREGGLEVLGWVLLVIPLPVEASSLGSSS